MKGRELDKIDKFLLEEMDAEELKAFEQSMQNDTTLKTDVRIREAIHHGINEEYQQELKSKLIQHDKELARKNWLTPLIRIAAVAIIVIVGLYSTYKNYYQVNTSKYDFYEEGIRNYMNDNADKVLFNNAMSKFRNEEYGSSVLEFEKLLDLNPVSDTINYYLGVSYFRDGEFDKSISVLNVVLANGSSPYHQKAEYRVGLAYLASNDKIQAKPIFEKIANSSTHRLSSEAKAILANW